MLASMASALSEYADERTGETLASSSTAVMTEETEETTDSKDTNRAAASEEDAEAKKEKMRALYGENKQITDDNYDKSLAVKCINGTFVGKKTDNIIAYKGIPFVGEQPVGTYRWKAPVGFTADDGVYEAYYNGKTPCQIEDSSELASLYGMGEDCLNLNIWKADDASEEKKPVMVWIHGGAFMFGGTVDPLYDFHNFVKENPDVIVVSIEYRLGIFGYLHLSHLPDGGDYPDAQNLGVMDQVMALKWVHENIGNFGGDPDNVTIWGESAGAGSVTVIPLVEGAQAYFNRVIAHSGAPSFTISTKENIEHANRFMGLLGCETAADLQKVGTEKLLEASIVALGLSVSSERDGNYLPLDPYEEYGNGSHKNIDILHGCNKDEMDYFVHAIGPDNFVLWAADRMTHRMAKLTDEDQKLVPSFLENAQGEEYERNSALFSQLWFKAAHIRLSEEQAKGGGKSYTYYFTPESTLPYMHCGHGTELPGIFNHPEQTAVTGRTYDETFSRTMRKMWVQFAKTGNPSLSADISPDGKAYEWPLYDPENKEVMVLDESNIHPEKESERKIVDWERTYPLTKYYNF